MDAASFSWAQSEFGATDLGDTRRTTRLVAMAAAACERPSGRVAAVFGTDREREGAYDFLESAHVDAIEIMASVAAATMRRAKDADFLFVPVDGTTISVVDDTGERDFGEVGPTSNGGRGLQIIDALAVEPDGMVVGWLALTFWARKRVERGPDRPLAEKETRHVIDTVHAASMVLEEHGKRGWFQIDRAGDGKDILRALSETRHLWTVRGCSDRCIELENGTETTLRTEMEERARSSTYLLQVPARPRHAARVAHMVVRVARQVVLYMKTGAKQRRASRLSVNVVWAREEGTAPPGEKPLDWLLYTNYGVETPDDAQLVLTGYTHRWRVEECHRTWKSGACDIESTQLQSFEAVQRWAIILGAVATRIERLKRLARRPESTPASVELTRTEIDALKLLRSETYGEVPEPTIAEAVLWLAELGGWTKKYSGKPPGAVVLGRGLRYLRPAARMLALTGARDQSIP